MGDDVHCHNRRRGGGGAGAPGEGILCQLLFVLRWFVSLVVVMVDKVLEAKSIEKYSDERELAKGGNEGGDVGDAGKEKGEVNVAESKVVVVVVMELADGAWLRHDFCLVGGGACVVYV